jgi:two-component system cell cycle sensor histidine kinase/response regulator CckA
MLAQSQPAAKLLFISGYANNEIAKHGVFEAGGSFLQKPFTIDELLEKVDNILND